MITIRELMQRSNVRHFRKAVTFIMDGFNQMASQVEPNAKLRYITLTEDVDKYDLPTDMVALKSVSIKDTDDDNKYKRIRRLVHEPIVTEDTNP